MPNPMEEMASKGMGKAKAAKAGMKGLQGIFKTLTEEHGEVSALLKRVSASSDPEVRRDLFPKIRKELLSHEKGEMQELYPVLRKRQDTREIAEEHDQEASQLEQTIERLNAIQFDDPDWERHFDHLVELVQHHTQEEENEYFPRANDVIGDQAEALDSRYKETKQNEMQKL